MEREHVKTGQQLRDKRVLARVPGHILAVSAGISRARLSDLERGVSKASEQEMLRLDDALDRLIGARRRISEVAAQCGWPMPPV